MIRPTVFVIAASLFFAPLTFAAEPDTATPPPPATTDDAPMSPISEVPVAPSVFKPIDFEKMHDDELGALDRLAGSDYWTDRVFALQRLERYKGDAVKQRIIKAASDDDWHVRCWALYLAVRSKIKLPAGLFNTESEPRVVRLALRLGIDVPPATVRRHALAQMRRRNIESSLLGIEIAAASDDQDLQRRAALMVKRFNKAFTPEQRTVFGERITALTRHIEYVADPERPDNKIPKVTVAKDGEPFVDQSIRKTILARPVSWLANQPTDKFFDVIDYLGELRLKDIETVVCMDATGSMGGSIRAAQREVDRLILIQNDLAKSMRFGFVAYRDVTDGKYLVESHGLTSQVDSIRAFLFQVKPRGGGDLPESILAGLIASGKVGWSRDAVQRIIVVADAPPHDRDWSRIEEVLEKYKRRGILTSAMAVRSTAETPLKEIAKAGGGECVSAEGGADLAKHIMRLSITDTMRPAFDEFFDLYVEFCL